MNLHAAIVKSLDNEDMTASAIIGEAGAAAALNEHEYLEVQRSHGDDEDTEPPNAPSSAADIPSVYQTSPEPLQWALGMWVLMMDIRLLHRTLRRRMK